jgi:hypothetical protein
LSVQPEPTPTPERRPDYFMASFAFEARSLAEAERIVSRWIVSEGVTLTGLGGTIASVGTPVTTTRPGPISDVFDPDRDYRRDPPRDLTALFPPGQEPGTYAAPPEGQARTVYPDPESPR